MSGATIRYEFRGPRQAQTGADVPRTPPPSRAARMLALAHYVERLVEEEKLATCAEAAQALGLTRARMTQIMNLLLLSPDLQEQLLTGEIALSERSLRCVVEEADWESQERKIQARSTEQGGLR